MASASPGKEEPSASRHTAMYTPRNSATILRRREN